VVVADDWAKCSCVIPVVFSTSHSTILPVHDIARVYLHLPVQTARRLVCFALSPRTYSPQLISVDRVPPRDMEKHAPCWDCLSLLRLVLEPIRMMARNSPHRWEGIGLVPKILFKIGRGVFFFFFPALPALLPLGGKGG
jgi:hypothetical protein